MRAEFIKLTCRVFTIFAIVSFLSVSNISAQSGKSVLKGEIATKGPDGTLITLPGARTVLTGITPLAEPVTLFADETGEFNFKNINAGNYSLEASLDGFVSAKKTVNIAENQSVTENFELEFDVISATVNVDSETRQINTSDATVAETITTKNLQNAPLFEEKFQDSLPLIPGVVRGPDGLINVKGSQSSQSGTLIGASNGDDPVTGNMSIDLPLEAVESVQVISNPYSAEFGNFNGGVVKIQTNSGADKWKFGLNSFFPRFRSRNGSIHGIESATPRVHFGGPIKKDKLFVFQTFEYKFVQTQVESLPDLQSDTKLESFDSFTRIDYNFSDFHRTNFTFALFPQKLDFVNLNTFNPQDTAANLHQRGWMFALNDQFVTQKGGVLQTTFSVKQADADVFGNSSVPFTIAPQTNSGGFFNRQNRETRRYEAQSIYSLPPIDLNGQHLLKFGGGFGYTVFDGTNTNTDVRIARGNGTLNQLQTYLGDGILSRNKSEVGFFVHDKWIVTPQLALDIGVRFDRDNLDETLNPAPRLGFVLSPFTDNKTVIRGGFGVFFSKIPLNVGVFEQNQNVAIRRFATDGITPIGETLFRNELENSDIETPYSLGWNLQADREISERVTFRVGYEQRETKRDFILNPFLGTNANEGIYQLGNGGRSSYRELLLMSRIRLQKDRELLFSYTRSRTVGDLNTFGSFSGNISNPIIRRNEYSRLSFDTPNRLLFWGDFGLPFGITFSPVVDWRTGFPYSVVNENQDFIGRRNADSRFPAFFSTDLQIFKDIKLGFREKDYKLRAGVKFFNITNHFNPRDIQNNLDSFDFGAFSNSVSRKIRFKFEFAF